MPSFWETINEPLLPELDIENKVGAGVYGLGRALSTPLDIALTPFLGPAKHVSKIPKIGGLFKNPTARTAAKGILSGLIGSQAPVVGQVNKWLGHDEGREREIARQRINELQIRGEGTNEDFLRILSQKAEEPPLPELTGQDALWGAAAAVPFAGSLRRKPRKIDQVLKDIKEEGGARFTTDPKGKTVDAETGERPFSAYRPKSTKETRTPRKKGDKFVSEMGSFEARLDDALAKAETDEDMINLMGNLSGLKLKGGLAEFGKPATSGIYKSVGSAGRTRTGEELWSDLLRNEVMPEGEDMKRLYEHIVGAGLVKGEKNLTPDQMKEIIDLVSQIEINKGALKTMRPRGKDYLQIDNQEPFDQAWHRFVHSMNVSRSIGNKPLEKQHWAELNRYLTDTGQATRASSGRLNYQKDIADKVKGFRNQGRIDPAVRFFGNLGQMSKSLILTAGIPKTGINIHGLQIFARSLFDPNAPTGKTLRNLINPGAARAEMSKAGDSFTDAARSGVRFSTEWNLKLKEGGADLERGVRMTDIFGRAAEGKIGTGADKFLDWQEKTFSAPLMESVLPVLKRDAWVSMRNDLMKSGMDHRKAAFEAAKVVNTRYGGIDTSALVWKNSKGEWTWRDPKMKHWMRALFLAPDWLETGRKHFVANMPKPLLKVFNGFIRDYTKKGEINIGSDVEREALQKTGRFVIGLYLGMNMMQKATTGNYMFENQSGKKFSFDTGIKDSEGKKVYVPLGLGTAFDFFRLPLELGSSALSGDLPEPQELVRGRISSPVKGLMNVITNTDYAGRPLTGTDAYGRRIPPLIGLGNVGREVVDVFIPQYFDALYNYTQGNYSPEQAISQSLELPVQYSRPFHPRR